MINYDNFRERLFSQRISQQLSQSELGRKANIAPAQISRYESGKNNPREDIISKLAEALNVTFDWLAYGTDPKHKHDIDDNIELSIKISKKVYDLLLSLSLNSNISVTDLINKILEDYAQTEENLIDSPKMISKMKNAPENFIENWADYMTQPENKKDLQGLLSAVTNILIKNSKL